MKIEIYLDTLFFMNLIINLWILLLLRRRFSLETKGYRMFGAAGLGAAVYISLFLVPSFQVPVFLQTFMPVESILLQFIALIISIPTMAVILLPKRKRYLWRKVIVQGFIYSFVIAGVLRAVFFKWRIFAGREISFFAILFGVYICVQIGGLCIQKGRQFGRKSICRAVINSAGRQTGVKALLDTGNSLLEPISKKPVCLVEEELLARITLENPLFYRAIPFRSVGCEQGILYGVEIPELTIVDGEQCYRALNVICAGVPHKLSHKNAYQMILHPALCTEENIEK